MHDLVRLFAAEQADRDQAAEARLAALVRVIDYYTKVAYTGDRLLFPHRGLITLERTTPLVTLESLPDTTSTTVWFSANYECLLASVQIGMKNGLFRQAWQLAWCLHSFQYQQGYIHNNIATWKTGLNATRRLGDIDAQARAHRRLGQAYARASMHDEAIDQLGQALKLAEERGANDTQAHTHHALAQAWEAKNDYQQALIHAILSLRLHRGLDNEQWLAIALNGAGWSLAHVGRYREASEHCENALALYRKHCNIQGEATTLSSLGYISQHTNRPDQALAYYGEAVSRLHEMGNDYEEADTLSLLGETQALLYQYDEARATWRRALSLYEAQQRMPEARRIHQRLDELNMQSK